MGEAACSPDTFLVPGLREVWADGEGSAGSDWRVPTPTCWVSLPLSCGLRAAQVTR